MAFFFLGETLLIPHLYPVVEALAKESDLAIDLWVSTSVHEELLGKWISGLGPATVRIRRAWGYRDLPGYHDGRNPPLPSKARLLAGMLPHLARTPVVVSAEQTTLWIPTLLPFLRTRFINIMHGGGSINSRDGRRRRAAWRMPVPSEYEQQQFVRRGFDPSRVPVVGYMKTNFHHGTRRGLQFPEARPIVLFNPHWQRHRSCWWNWGRDIVRQLVGQDRYNVIIAPHQRLAEGDPGLRQVLQEAARHSHVVSDIDSFAMVDGSYPGVADIYLGDTSSQVIEFMARPRPCVFLNSNGTDWRQRADYLMWTGGEVIESAGELLPALDRAAGLHAGYAPVQQQLARTLLGETGGGPERVVRHILEALAA